MSELPERKTTRRGPGEDRVSTLLITRKGVETEKFARDHVSLRFHIPLHSDVELTEFFVAPGTRTSYGGGLGCGRSRVFGGGGVVVMTHRHPNC